MFKGRTSTVFRGCGVSSSLSSSQDEDEKAGEGKVEEDEDGDEDEDEEEEATEMVRHRVKLSTEGLLWDGRMM